MENGMFWSEIGTGFGEPGGTPPPQIPRSTPRVRLSIMSCKTMLKTPDIILKADFNYPLLSLWTINFKIPKGFEKTDFLRAMKTAEFLFLDISGKVAKNTIISILISSLVAFLCYRLHTVLPFQLNFLNLVLGKQHKTGRAEERL